MPGPRILVLNAGSSSLKASLVELPDTTLAQAQTSWGADASRAVDRKAGIARVIRDIEALPASGPGEDERGSTHLDAVGYRVVHGGERFGSAVLIDRDVVDGIRSVAGLAPLHNGVAIETIEAGRQTLPDVPHVACFDTAFHATLAPDAYRYPVPERWYTKWGVRRYGFHGLSVAWAVRRAASLLDRDVGELGVVVAHLGSGCSVTAVQSGRSVDTSMGMTPLEGLMMGTRSGSIDPGVPFFLSSAGYLDETQIAAALDHESGLAGVSGIGSDMRRLQQAADEGDDRASLALTMFVRRAAAGIAAAATSLADLDAVVFTGGIGEHATDVRRQIVERLAVLSLAPLPTDDQAVEGDARINATSEDVAILRIEAREDLTIAREVAEVLASL